ncbi:MAG: hypothetical protein AAF829_03430 [Pseudomonadota bacterium]
MLVVIKTVFHFGPLLFGIGFIAPLFAQIMDAMDWAAPFGLNSLVFGLIVGGAYGLVAQIRGRWI